MFGTMTKSFHVGRAAQNGLTAALLAQQNFTSSEQALEGKSGWANVLSSSRSYSEITAKLGSSYEILLNTYKPYACGIVIHPVIDGCIQLRNQHKLTAASIERIELRVHPLVLELTGKKTPNTGLDGKFSVFFAAALAIVQGKAGEREFTDALARNPEIVALRDRVSAKVSSAIHEDQARIAITLKDGKRLENFVEHAKGSVEKPMTDAELEAKFESLANGVLTGARAKRVMQLCWSMERLPDASAVLKEATI
jgi:2-methylcitrate dehydratase PrpD